MLSGTVRFVARDSSDIPAVRADNEDAPLVITSSDGDGSTNGRLEANVDVKNRYGAGIGGEKAAVIIRGGTVVANGGARKPGKKPFFDGRPAIGSSRPDSSAYIEITGGNVNATASDYGVAIGSYSGEHNERDATQARIRVSGGNVVASAKYGAAIGTGYLNHVGADIQILGGTVTAENLAWNGRECIEGSAAIGNGPCSSNSRVKIAGGSVFAANMGSVDAISSLGDSVGNQLAQVAIPQAAGVDMITVDGLRWTRQGGHPDNDGAWYAWVSKQDHQLVVGGVPVEAKWTGSSFDLVDKWHGWKVSGGAYGTDWTTSEKGTLTINNPGEYTVERTGDTVCRIRFAKTFQERTTLTLGNVNCDGNREGAGLDPSGSGVTLKLAGNAQFRGGNDQPGVLAQGKDAEHRVEITSAGQGGAASGSLTAIGGILAAGIGGGKWGSGSNIEVSGGVVTANGNGAAAGIGGGYRGSGSNIEVSGGVVTANGGGGAAGIGGGESYHAHDLHITGGTVTATGGCNSWAGCGLAIGHGGLPDGVLEGKDSDEVEITGGSVKTTGDGDAAQIGGITVKARPDWPGHFSPPLVLVTVPAQSASGVNKLTIDGVEWSRSGGHPVSQTETDGAWYAWVTKKLHKVVVNDQTLCYAWEWRSETLKQKNCEDLTPPTPEVGTVVRSLSTASVSIKDPGAANTYGGLEYSIDGGKTWRSENTFTNLSAGTTHTIRARYAGNENYLPSAELSVNVEAAPALPDAPTGEFSIKSGQTLSEVSPPGGWTWVDDTKSFDFDPDQVAGVTADVQQVITAPGGQEFDYTGAQLPSRCDLNPVKGTELTLTCAVDLSLNRVANEWTTQVSMGSWTFGQAAPEPTAVARYGTVEYTYSGTVADGSTYQQSTVKPTRAGTYEVVASVKPGQEDGTYYEGLEGKNASEAPFSITSGSNAWKPGKEPSVVDWEYDQPANKPQGEAQHGTVVFEYKKATEPDTKYVEWGSGPTDAGDYVLRGRVEATTDYAGLTSDPVPFKIARAATTIDTVATIENLTYGDRVVSAPEVTWSGSSVRPVITWQQQNQDGSWGQETSVVPVNVGTYRAVVNVAWDGNYKAADTAYSQAFTISQRTPTVTVTGIADRRFDGHAVTPSATVGNLANGDAEPSVEFFFEKQAAGGAWDVFEGDPVEAGTYRVTAKTIAGGNYAQGVSRPAEFTIGASDQLKVALSGALGKRYNGGAVSSPTVTVTGVGGQSVSDAQVAFSWQKKNESGTWVDTDPNPKDAGTYQVRATAKAANYGDAVSDWVSFTIGQADPRVEITKDPSKHYDGEATADPEFTTSGTVTDASFTWFVKDDAAEGGWRQLASAPKDVGSYKVVASVAAGGNYTAGSGDRPFTISEHTEMVVALSGKLGKTYDGQVVGEPQVTVSGAAQGDPKNPEVTLIWEQETEPSVWHKIDAAPKDAGSYRVSAQVSAANYEPKTSEALDFVIDQADSTVIIDAIAPREWDGRPQAEPTYSVVGSRGVVSVAWFDDKGGLLESAPSDAGTYQVQVSVVADRNFKAAEATKGFTISKVPATVSGLEAVKDLVYTGGPHTLVTTPTVTGGNMEYAVGATRPADDSQAWSKELPKVTDAGEYTVVWRVVPDGNHTSIGGDAQVKVAAAGPTVTAKPAHPITFGQTFADADVTVAAVFGGKSVEGTTQWADTDRELTLGVHEFTGMFTPKDTKNFKAVPVTVTVQVDKAPATVSGLEAVGKLVFNGQPQALVTTPTVVGGTIEYAVGMSAPSSPDAWDQALPSGSHAGSATVFWRVIPDGNHTEAHGQVPVVIAPKVAAVDGQLASGFTFIAEEGEYVIRDGQTRLSFGTDYTFELVNASFETQTADVEITFSGDYTGFAVVKNAMATEWGGVGPVEWKPGSGNVSLDLGEGSSPVTGVQVDDKPLDQGTFHRSDDGKLVVDSSVLEGLSPGDHTLEVRLEDGSVIVYPIRVLPADKPAPLFTGEWLAWLLTWPILLWMVLRTFAPWLLPFFLR